MSSIVVTPPLVIAAGAIFPPVCALIVGVRFYCRKWQGGSYGLDDYLILPALALLIGMAAAILRGVALKAIAYPTPLLVPGTELTSTSPQETHTKQIFVTTELLQVVSLGLIKVSALLFYRRVFNVGTRRTFNFVSNAAIVFCVAWTLTFFFGLLFECGSNVYYQYSNLENEQKCGKATSGIQHGFAVTDLFTDLVVLIFPMPLVWRLQANLKRKLLISSVFLVGILTVMASLTRMVIYIEVLDAELSSAPPDPDLLTSAGIYFMLIETGLGLIAVCLPTLYTLVGSKHLQQLVRSFGSALSLKDRSPRASRQSPTRKVQKNVVDPKPFGTISSQAESDEQVDQISRPTRRDDLETGQAKESLK